MTCHEARVRWGFFPGAPILPASRGPGKILHARSRVLKLENYPGLQPARRDDPDARASAPQHPASEIPETIATATRLLLPGRPHYVLRAPESRQTLHRHRSAEFFRLETRQTANRPDLHQEPS